MSTGGSLAFCQSRPHDNFHTPVACIKKIYIWIQLDSASDPKSRSFEIGHNFSAGQNSDHLGLDENSQIYRIDLR